ncbi:MAG: PAS domain S-box protein [Mangrovibacterium sp.]|nr:PAS domain S-box protein [Mangrovibacterium sp.]
MDRKIYHYTKKQLIILAVMTSILLIIGGHLYYRYERQGARKETYNDLQAVGRLKAHQLAQWYQERLSEASFFSGNLPYTQYAKNIILRKSGEDEVLLRNALSQIMTNKRYENIFMLDKQGQVLFSVDPGFVFRDTIINASTRKVFRTGEVIVKDFYFCDFHQEVHYQIIAPVADSGKKVIAALVFSSKPADYLYPLIQEWPTPCKTAETVLVRQNGDTVWYLNNLRHLPNSALQVGFSLDQTEKPAVRAVLGQTGFFEGPDYAGMMVLGDISKVPQTPWHLIVKIDAREAYAELNKRATLIAIIIFLAIFFVGTAVALIDHRRQRNIYRELSRKRLELHESQREFGATLYSIGDGVITTDREGMVRHLNPVAEKLTGWTEAGARGKPVTEVFHIVNEGTRQEVENPVHKVLRDGKTIGLANHTVLIARNGTETPIADSGAPIADDRGNTLGVVMVFRDQREERENEKALRDSEKKHRTLISSMQLGLAVHEIILDDAGQPVDYRFLDVNSSFERLTGLKRGDILGKTVLEVLPNTEKIWIERYGRVVLTGVPDSFESYSQELNRFYSVLAYQCDDNQFAVITEDITSRKQMEIRLRESEKKYRELIDGMNETVWVIDFEGKVVDVNRRAVKVLGYTKEELLGIGLYGIDSSLEKEMITNLVRNMPDDKLQIFETSHQAKDGRVFPVEIYSSLVTYQGKKAILSIARDITHRKRMEEQRRHDEQVQQILYEIAKTSMSEKALDYLLIVVRRELSKVMDTTNFYAALYHPETDTLRKIIFMNERFTIEEWNAEKSFSGQLIRAKKTILLQHDEMIRFAEENGLNLPVTPAACWLGVPLMDDQKAIGVVVVQSYSDKHAYNEKSARLLEMIAHQLTVVIQRSQMIQDLITAKEKAEESDRLQSAFLANMSHEIRTPMNGILGFLSLLNEPELEDESKKEYLDIVNKSGQRLLDTINDIIEIAKIEAGGSKAFYEEVDMEEIMRYHHDFFKLQTDEKGLQLNILEQITGPEAFIRADRTKLDSILTNLIKNAIKFTKEGSIELGNYIKRDMLVFYVKDTGSGISPNRKEAIFERFVQADQNRNRAYEGAGLGLSITKAYVNALGGKISVQSEPGKGSTFTFSIPYQPVAEQRKPAGPLTGISEMRPSGKITILIAEDDEASYQLLRIILEKEGISSLHTMNGADTVKAVQENPAIAMILMDIQMPDVDGLEATRQIRMFNKTIPIIAQTAYALSDDDKKAIEAGCNDYIAKPIKRRDLLALIKKYAGKI